MDKPVVVIHGASSPDEVPGIAAIEAQAELRAAPDLDSLRAALPGADVLLGWKFAASDLQAAWDSADRLKWIHWCGAGVDAALFPKLSSSDVCMTNVRGVFDQPMAEYTLGLILAFAKDLPRTLDAQRERRWDYRLTRTVAERSVLVVGVGSIGRAIGTTLRNVGMRVTGVGRHARDGGPAFERIAAISELDALLPQSNFVVLITPLTEATRGLFGQERFAHMRSDSYFINLGRGALVDEAALVDALSTNKIAGAGLDVFQTEPLPSSSPLWDLSNVIISPHMSGDFDGFHGAMADIFYDNFRRYVRGEALRNVVDKQLGFVAD